MEESNAVMTSSPIVSRALRGAGCPGAGLWGTQKAAINFGRRAVKASLRGRVELNLKRGMNCVPVAF